jgi:rubrerythrin
MEAPKRRRFYAKKKKILTDDVKSESSSNISPVEKEIIISRTESEIVEIASNEAQEKASTERSMKHDPAKKSLDKKKISHVVKNTTSVSDMRSIQSDTQTERIDLIDVEHAKTHQNLENAKQSKPRRPHYSLAGQRLKNTNPEDNQFSSSLGSTNDSSRLSNQGIEHHSSTSSSTALRLAPSLSSLENESSKRTTSCLICANEVEYLAVSSCFHAYCSVCALRMRIKSKDKNCAVCKSHMQSVMVSHHLRFEGMSSFELNLFLDDNCVLPGN